MPDTFSRFVYPAPRMRLVATALEVVAFAILGAEILVYAVRRYEVASSGSPAGLRRGLVNVLGSFLADGAALSATTLGTAIGWLWPFTGRQPGVLPPVLFVAGFAGTRADFFLMAWRLRRLAPRSVEAVGWGLAGADLDRAAARVALAIERVVAHTGGGRIDVVAHGIGGLVARAALARLGAGAPVRRLVTLGTPHQGTKLAALAPEALGRSLEPGSRFLRALAEAPTAPHVEVVSIHSPFDAVVLPFTHARCPGASYVEVDGIGHNALLFSPKVAILVAEALGV